MKKLILILIFVIFLIGCYKTPTGDVVQEPIKTQPQQKEQTEPTQVTETNSDETETKTESKEEITATEKLKNELDIIGYKVFLIFKGKHTKGNYLNIIYEETDNEGIEDLVNLRKFGVKYFPNKDFYLTSSINYEKERSEYWVINKRDTLSLIAGEDPPAKDNYIFSYRPTSAKWDDYHRGYSFTLSKEEYSLLEFNNVVTERLIAEFKGTGNTKTETFKALTRNTKISFFYFTDDPDYAIMNVRATKLGSDISSTSGSTKGGFNLGSTYSGMGDTHLYEKGTFYLDVNVANVNSWTVSVYEVR